MITTTTGPKPIRHYNHYDHHNDQTITVISIASTCIYSSPGSIDATNYKTDYILQY